MQESFAVTIFSSLSLCSHGCILLPVELLCFYERGYAEHQLLPPLLPVYMSLVSLSFERIFCLEYNSSLVCASFAVCRGKSSSARLSTCAHVFILTDPFLLQKPAPGTSLLSPYLSFKALIVKFLQQFSWKLSCFRVIENFDSILSGFLVYEDLFQHLLKV